MAYINGHKVLSVARTVYQSELDIIARYHLGEYDAYQDNNDGTATITRQTQYLNANDLTINVADLNAYDGTVTQMVIANASFLTDVQFISNVLVRDTTWNNGLYHAKASNGQIYFNIPLQTSNENAIAYARNLNIALQVQLAISYTEQVIVNRPLNTLDQQGSQWLRNEWEKGLNLFTCPNYSGTANNVTYSIENGIITLNGTASANTYIDLDINLNVISPSTISFNNIGTKTSGNMGFYLYNSVGTWLFDTWNFNSNTSNYTGSISKMRIYIASGVALTNYQIRPMLNYGDHAYPYQEYNGDIVRTKDIEPVLLWENGSPNSAFSSTTLSISGLSNYKYIVIEYQNWYSSTATIEGGTYIKIENKANSSICQLVTTAIDELKVFVRQINVLNNDELDIFSSENIVDVETDDGTNIPVRIYGTNVL